MLSRRILATAMFTAASLTGCSPSSSKSGLSDSTTVADLELPNQGGSQPELRDVPVDSSKTSAEAQRVATAAPVSQMAPQAPQKAPATAPQPAPRQTANAQPRERATAPSPAPQAAPQPQRRLAPTIDAGTTFAAVLTEKVCTNTAHQGDELVARTEAAVAGRDGASVPAGSMIGFRIVSIAGNVVELTPIAVVLDEQNYTLTGTAKLDLPLTVVATKAGRAKKGGLFGALAGVGGAVLAGKDAKTAIAAGAVGAAAGAGVGAATGGNVACTAESAHVTAQLTSPLLLKAK